MTLTQPPQPIADDALFDAGGAPARPAVRPARANRTSLMLLADGRFPAGGHAHSGGVEAAVAAGRVSDGPSLAAFCRGRLHTTGLTTAALAAAAATVRHDPSALDAAADARIPGAALRGISRKLGRQMARAARAVWPSPQLDRLVAERPRGAHQPVVLGLTAHAAGLTAVDAAHAAAYETVSVPANAAVRLLGLDPFETAAILAELASEVDGVADEAATAAHTLDPDALPAASAPLLDIMGEVHAIWRLRLFAS